MSNATPKNEKILIIDDDDAIRERTFFMLESKGFEILEANSGISGIELAKTHHPDLILLDIVMPEIDGFETCKRLKDSLKTSDIPIIFMSSLTDPHDKIKGLELGAVDYINNVIDQGELLARVETHLHIKAVTQELMKREQLLSSDLHAAANIQKSFLPPNHMQIGNLQLASLWKPLNPLGGDIFNIIPCDQSKLALYMIDVSGHDMPSALVTISVSQYLRQKNTAARPLLSPTEMMLSLDKEYPMDRFDRYFTIFYMILDHLTGKLSYSSAGHPPAILLSKDRECKLLESGGRVIGLAQKIPFEEGNETLRNGDKVFLYTDGITDLKNNKDESYGVERLCSLLEESKGDSVEMIIHKVQISMQEFAKNVSQDDASMMCFEFKEYKVDGIGN